MTQFDPNHGSDKLSILVVAIIFGLATSAVAVFAAAAHV